MTPGSAHNQPIMDEISSTNAPEATGDNAPSSEAVPSLAPPSTSVLSDAPMTDALEAADSQGSLPKASADRAATPSSFQTPQFSAQTESILKRINVNAANAAAAGTPGWEAAREQVMRDMATSDKFPTPTPPRESSGLGQGGPSASGNGEQTVFKVEGEPNQTTPGSRGRGRGGRPRGRGRGGGRGGKRKREDRSDDESEESEVYSPVVTTTKSGRSVQKPTSFVPPPPSPTTTNKRKRPYRRNPESAVCKVCLRGTSPATNMIVFCDGCNTPYHQYCHHPPIDQAVVNEVDKEWFCTQCEKLRVVPVPESEVADFIASGGASAEQRQKYFASLPPGMLVTLLTKATTLKPDLPVFAPDFQARSASNAAAHPALSTSAAPTNGHAHPSTTSQNSYSTAQNPQIPMPQQRAPQHSQASTGAPQYGSYYVNHPQQEYVPEGHPVNYPRPGHGLMRTLPPEQEDLQWLVDDDDRYGVFSHMYQVDPQAANAGMNGGMGQAR